ncbi:MAG: hypothetical protein ACTSUD_03235 [Alphaproteobacteria bacterium]
MRDSIGNALLFQVFGSEGHMSGTTKRLDLQFGVFACSVQGFEDPVQPVQQVLQALQSLLEETPEIADAGISFDAEAIERLVGEVARRADIDEENVEIVPGLIIVHRGGGNVAAGEPEAFDARYDEGGGDGEGGEAWSRPFVAGAADPGDTGPSGSDSADAEIAGESHEPEADDSAEPAFVNIFSPGAHADTDTDADAEGASGPDTAAFDVTAEADPAGSDPYAAVEDDHDGAPPRDIFADTGDSAGGSVFTDSMAANTAAEPTDETAGETAGETDPVNFFAARDQADENADEPSGAGPDDYENVFASTAPEDAREETPDEMPEETSGEPGEPDDEPERVESLFGRSEDQPVVEEVDEGYTAAGLAQAAGAETVADLMVSAAAWMVLIQGQTTFTRRDVIEVFMAMPGKHSKSLEARIKGFGKAVRNSHLVMVEDGVFGLSRTELDRFQTLL